MFRYKKIDLYFSLCVLLVTDGLHIQLILNINESVAKNMRLPLDYTLQFCTHLFVPESYLTPCPFS